MDKLENDRIANITIDIINNELNKIIYKDPKDNPSYLDKSWKIK